MLDHMFKSLSDIVITSQQEDGLKSYKLYCDECLESDLPILSFLDFYGRWQEENGLFSDSNLLHRD